MRVAIRHISVFLIAVFAVFYCGNTVFIHSHLCQGHLVTHSHPYLPGNAHSHSAAGFEYIAQNNLVAASLCAAAEIALPPRCSSLLAVIEVPAACFLDCVDAVTAAVRGPPSVRLAA